MVEFFTADMGEFDDTGAVWHSIDVEPFHVPNLTEGQLILTLVVFLKVKKSITALTSR